MSARLLTRTTRSLLVTALAVATVAAGMLAADDGATTTLVPASGSAPAASAPGTVTAAPVVRAAGIAGSAPQTRDFGFFTASSTSRGRTYVRFDRAVLLTGPEAVAARVADGGSADDGPDHYVRNDNPKVRVLRLSQDVRVLGSQVLTGSPALKPVSLARLLRQVAQPGTYPPFVLRYGRNGDVVAIAEQYLA